MDAETYCREIEAYLCQKNDGHLVRVVGPAFGMVTGWAVQGVPFKVACRGIDRCFERYYAKGPRRRPVRIEFCEADVLDVFDEWKRAVGVGMAGAPATAGGAAPAEENPVGGDARVRPGHSLRAHLDRAVLRLTDLQARGGLPGPLQEAVDRLIERFSADREASRTLRGDSREAYLRDLQHADAELLDVARAVTTPDVLAELRNDAAGELAEYRARMISDAYDRAVQAAADKLLRDHWKLPTLTYPS